MAELSEEQRRKISEGMKRAHERRRKQRVNNKTPGTRNGGLLGRLRAMRELLDQAIKDLERLAS